MTASPPLPGAAMSAVQRPSTAWRPCQVLFDRQGLASFAVTVDQHLAERKRQPGLPA